MSSSRTSYNPRGFRVSDIVPQSAQSRDQLIQPVSMEDKGRYVARFADHCDMRDLFSDEAQRREVAADLFAARWDEAPVTVRKLNGEMFFID